VCVSHPFFWVGRAALTLCCLDGCSILAPLLVLRSQLDCLLMLDFLARRRERFTSKKSFQDGTLFFIRHPQTRMIDFFFPVLFCGLSEETEIGMFCFRLVFSHFLLISLLLLVSRCLLRRALLRIWKARKDVGGILRFFFHAFCCCDVVLNTCSACSTNWRLRVRWKCCKTHRKEQHICCRCTRAWSR
jgi:hypothetical protein